MDSKHIHVIILHAFHIKLKEVVQLMYSIG